ncbi:MAG: hypothetical protein QXE51_03310 [Nitrososphaeria archaeon]
MSLDFLQKWELLKSRQLHYYTIPLNTARNGTNAPNDYFIISGDVFFILQNDAPDLQIAFNTPDKFIPIPRFGYGKGKVRIIQAFDKIFMKHSSIADGKLIIAAGFPESIEIDVFTGQYVYLIDVDGNTINPAQAPVYSLYVKDVSVTTTAQPIDTQPIAFKLLTLQNDSGSAATVYVGTASQQLYPIPAGASQTLAHVMTNHIYVKTLSGTATLHVIGGGHE